MARRITIATIGLFILIGCVAGIVGPRRILRRVSRDLERGWLIVTGGLVDVGGYRLRIEREGKGSPTVVMDAGLCQTMSTWGRVPSEVAKFTSVVIFERAGLGQSDLGPRPRTSEQNVAELHSLLVNAGISGPYVFVGHSFGGLNVRLYASEHPDEVAGMVLLDASHEEQSLRFAALMAPGEREKYLTKQSGANCERVDLLASGKQVHTAASLPPIPLVVLTAQWANQPDSAPTPEQQAYTELQEDLARLISNSKHIIVKNSGHFIQLDQPDVVIDSIRMVVESARSHFVAGRQRSNSSGRQAPDIGRPQ